MQDIDAAIERIKGVSSLEDATRIHSELAQLRDGLRRFSDLNPPAQELVTRTASLNAALVVLQNAKETFAAAAEAIAVTRTADQKVTYSKWIEADDLYTQAIERWNVHPELMSGIKVVGADGKSSAADYKAEIKKLEAKRARIAPAVKQQRAKEEAAAAKRKQEEAEAEALRITCGNKPVCGGWDGECSGLESAMKKVAHDPDSIDVENCTDPILTKDNCWITTCDVRGRNAFGAMILNRKKFSMSKLGITEL